MGRTEAAIRDRAADALPEFEHLEVRRMFSGFGFYINGLLVAAAWDGAFRLRHHDHGAWVYKAVDESAISMTPPSWCRWCAPERGHSWVTQRPSRPEASSAAAPESPLTDPHAKRL